MAEGLLELTRVDTQGERRPVLVNLGNVAWIEADDSGATRIVFAVGLPSGPADGIPLALVVSESLQQIARLSYAVTTTDHEAIAQAWADQTARRPAEPEAT
jgi:hypothetical protein